MDAIPALLGVHHVTAITGDAPGNVAFYTRALGLRLVKKTVNQDDVSAYHLFYGDEVGHPGSEVTFFHWPQAGPNRPGVGTVDGVALAVPGEDALAWWERRLAERGAERGEIRESRGRATLPFRDPEGQRLELVVAGPGGALSEIRPWAGGPVPLEHGIRGTFGVILRIARLGPTLDLMTTVLGFRRTDAYEEADGTAVTLLECGEGGAGTEVRLVVPASGSRGMPGIGGVHHVAFRAADDAAHRAWHERLIRSGIHCTPIIDRYYFKSIYFREPGGVLFEIATDGPGFATDEPMDRLGERLALPPFLEPRRAAIEAGLPPLPA